MPPFHPFFLSFLPLLYLVLSPSLPPQREWVSVWLSGEERWVLPSQILFQRNSSSEKHVCLQRANAGLLLQFHKRRRSARHAEINTNPKTNKYTKGKQMSSSLPTLTSFNPEPRYKTRRTGSKRAFPRLYMIYIDVKTHRGKHTCIWTHTHTLRRPVLSALLLWVRSISIGLTSNGGSTYTHTHKHTHQEEHAWQRGYELYIHPVSMH